MSNPAAMMIERLAKGRARESASRHTAPLDILVVDDDQATRLSLAFALSDAGHRVSEASDGEEAMALSAERTYDVALLDVRLPKVDGLTIFRSLRVRAPSTAVILMTAFATIPDAVASLREGAYDYVTKPFDPEELTLRVIGHISEHVSLKRELEEARRVVASREVGSPIVGHTPAMVQLVERVNTVAQSDAPVVVYGESGTGKGLVAHTLHARGPRKTAPFVTLDCGACPEEVLDAKLFGEQVGAQRRPGLLELAEGGTLMLDEVAALPLASQAKLLRVLDEGALRGASGEAIAVSARIVSTTQLDLKAQVAEGKLKGDLFLQLNVLDLHLPPLRERKPDIPLLLAHFLRRFCRGRVPPGIGPRAWEALVQYSFPGNVRELAHAVERAVALARGSEIDLEHLPDDIARSERAPEESAIAPLADASRSFEREHIVRALERAHDVRAAAGLLRISVRALRQKMERHGIAEPAAA
jgi:DNA-binding NtrC family response regulator